MQFLGPQFSVAALNNGPLAGRRNRIINGNFAVNQRGQTSGTAVAAAAYGHDRWKAGASGCTYTFAASLPDTTITITAGTLTQIIEAANIEGGAYTLSWSGTATARIYQGSATGSYAASPLTVTGLTAGTNTTVEFSAGTLGKVQLEPGSVTTPFERRPLGAEFVLCRYYFRYGGPGIGTWYLGGTSAAAQLMFDYSDMRPGTSPTITLANSAFTIADPGIANVAFSAGAMSANSVQAANATLNFTIGSGTQTGTPTQYHTALMTTSSVVAVSKEL